MAKAIQILAVFVLIIVSIGCQTESNHKAENIKYSFFVAGHTYGNPMHHQLGLYPPFVEHFDDLNATPKLELGILTGDVVAKSTVEYWEAALTDMDKINVPVHISRGNHDISPVYDSIFEKSIYAFHQQEDLFIILSPTYWSIKDAQLSFLDSTLNANKGQVKNTFIFAHELIWWSPEKYPDIKINYLPHYPGQTNYWDDVHPLLKNYNQPVYFFSGDVGCSENVTPYAFKNEDNVTFIASGMGGGKADNYILVTVDTNNQVKTEVVDLN
ncbi:MAG: metallophosphoesterase family protein [Putridiphycobacter sp.]